MTKPSIVALLSFALALSAGCNSGKKVEAQSIAVEPKVATVETQPTMFEWRGAHDGMSLAEFHAKFGKNCGESPNTGIYGCTNTDVDQYQSLVALFRHGQVYSFRLGCDGPENKGDSREYQQTVANLLLRL